MSMEYFNSFIRLFISFLLAYFLEEIISFYYYNFMYLGTTVPVNYI